MTGNPRISAGEPVQADLFGFVATPVAPSRPAPAAGSPGVNPVANLNALDKSRGSSVPASGLNTLHSASYDDGDYDDGEPDAAVVTKPNEPEEPQQEEIYATIKRILYPPVSMRDTEPFRVYLAKSKKEEFSISTASPITVNEGADVFAKGEWTTYRGRKTFKASLLIQQMPKDPQGIIGWFKMGSVPGVGKATGERIVAFHGANAINIMDNVDEITRAGVPVKKAALIVQCWENNAMQPKVVAYLKSLGIGEQAVTNIMRRYGMTSQTVIENNPWQLADTIDGIGFGTADEIARNAGHDMNSPQRIVAGIRFAIREGINRDGHCGLPIRDVLTGAQELLGLAPVAIMNEFWNAVDGNQYVFDEDTELATTAAILRTETELVDDLIRLMGPSGISEEQAAEAIDRAAEKLPWALDDSQRNAAIMALTQNLSIITGGPGTGKSTIQKVIIEALASFGERVVLGAPTGRAAKRQAELSKMPASTCHRLLQFSAEVGGFSFNSENQFPESRFILDEFSMVDLRLANSFIQAIKTGAGLTIVGDVDQLPSVGAGQVLRDAIDSGIVPTARLNTPHRQDDDAGGIITAAHRIKVGLHPNRDPNEKLSGFRVDAINDPEAIIKHVVKLMKHDLPAMGFDPLTDVQVLTSMRKRGIGVDSLNDAIKAALNPGMEDGNSVVVKKKKWTKSDRVMHINNNYPKQVYNGEVGFVVGTSQRMGENGKMEDYFKVDYSGHMTTYSAKDVDEVEQCWAATVHKSQGCEFPVVIMVCPSDHKFMLNRNLLYTGVTRAKTLCIVVGDHGAIQSAVDRSESVRRHTGLGKRLAAAMTLETDMGQQEEYAPEMSLA